MSDLQLRNITNQYIDKKINRRSFLITAGVFTGSITLGGVLTYYYRHTGLKRPYSKSQDKIVAAVQTHLFPKLDDSPGANDIDALHYLHFVLTDPEIDKDNKYLLINGVDWLEKECKSKYNKTFINLSIDETDGILKTIEDTNWGYRWISLNLIYIFEALLSDPIYGGNPNQIGWEWLEHTPGLPRPTIDNKYGK